MLAGPGNIASVKTTSYKVVVPFYLYAALSYLVATMLLFLRSNAMANHHFQPSLLAITHTMALGWGTMIILGASHQLVPVLIEGKLHSNALAYLSFAFAATGIPLLVYGFLVFNMGLPALLGGGLVIAAIFSFVLNICLSIAKRKSGNIHSTFVVAATLWLLLTTIVGWTLVCNFSSHCLPHESVHYLALHAHIGIIGWFLLIVIGVGARLIPLFLISKYNNTRLLRWIFYLINAALISFVFLYIAGSALAWPVPVLLIFCAITMFAYYCYRAYRERIRKSVDGQMSISLLSVAMLSLPLILLLLTTGKLAFSQGHQSQLINAYGFFIFFGWITAIILGMTFKTLPFIIWNKVYHQLSGKGKTPSPKDLFNDRIFHWMIVVYLLGFVGFGTGVIATNFIILKAGAFLLLLTAMLYNWNVLKVVLHKPQTDANRNQQ